MKTIYLLRHAKSSWDDPALDDHDRALNDRGRRAGKAMGVYLKENGQLPDLVICSTAKRARETLKRLRKTLGDSIPVRFESDLYMASPRGILKVLASADDGVSSVMIIGHNPGMHMLAMDLAESGDQEACDRIMEKYPTAALAVLTSKAKRWRDIKGCAVESFTCPRDLE